MKPDVFRGIIDDMRRGMQRIANGRVMLDTYDVTRQDEASPMKQIFGDRWSLVFGITRGIDIVRHNAYKERTDLYDDDPDIKIKNTDEWEEHYNEYGYGSYGTGLKLGRDLAFYQDRDFKFVEPDESKEDVYDFTFTE